MVYRRALRAMLGLCLLLGQGAGAQTAATAAGPKTVKRLPAAKISARSRRKAGAKSTATKHAVAGKKTAARLTGAKVAGSKTAGAKVLVAKTSPTAHLAAHSADRYRAATAVPPARLQVTRQEAMQQITEGLANSPVGIENAAALRPFFDQLRQLEADPKGQLVRVLQFGDSHTAADMFTGALRTLFQGKWGDGGAGFSYAGYPFAGYRIHGTKRAQSIDWTVEGTKFRELGDDALVGLGGVSLSTEQAGSWVSLDADATSLEVQYMTQPGGGPIEIYDGDQLLATVSTDGPIAAGHFDAPVEAGPHHFEVQTTDHAPVRLLGLTTENTAGVTYEAIGLNGAEASVLLRWDEALQQAYMEQVHPALIVLAYGTNEASDHTWSEESYAAMFRQLIERCRRLAPQAAILVIGPPDRELRAGRKGWAPFAGVDRIVEAQRSVCAELGCAYWDLRSRMGGFGSMREWVSVDWAQADHTHFTEQGYTELAGALFMDIVHRYEAYQGQATMAEGGAK
jgi:lysophospholipase L1-like esterase